MTNGTLNKINDQQSNSLLLRLSEVTTNSRQQPPLNGLFIALHGDHFDGHNFVNHAILSGATALLVDRPLNVQCPQVIVTDTRVAMGKLAAWVRNQSNAKVIGITGSSGKTSVKEMVATILAQCGETLSTIGNFNNDIGVSLTLFRLTNQHKYVVIEIGANRIGEIEYITNIVKPDVALVTNLFAAHLEGFGSLAGVANVKGKIFKGLSKQGTSVINLSSHDWTNWQDYFNPQQTIWRFSITRKQKADFYAKKITLKPICTEFELHTPIGNIAITLPLPGKHNVANAVAASALAISVGAVLEAISYGLANSKPVSGRLYPINLSPGKILLDDTYNANTGSMIAAADVLSKMPGYRIFVIGDMGELGDKTKLYHQEVSYAATRMNLDKIFSIGKYSIIISQNSTSGEHFFSKKELIAKLIRLIKDYDIVSVLVKGSRSIVMEEVVYAIREYFLC